MPIITLTIKINVPEGVTVEVAPEVETTPKVATMPTIMFSEEPEYPEWADKNNKRWSADEDAIAADLEYSDEDIATLTDRSVAAVHSYRLKRGYVPKSYSRTIDRTAERAAARWTKSEIEYLMKNFIEEDEVVESIAKHLGRSIAAVYRKHSYELQKQVDKVASQAPDWS